VLFSAEEAATVEVLSPLWSPGSDSEMNTATYPLCLIKVGQVRVDAVLADARHGTIVEIHARQTLEIDSDNDYSKSFDRVSRPVARIVS